MRKLKITNNITSKEGVALDKYLLEIGRIELISVEEEIELARKIKEGDEAALEKLVRSNLRFVVSVAKQYQNQGLSLSDLINEGNVGLMKAAKRFDETKGFKFISYAVWWIRQSILVAIVEYSRMVRLPFKRITAYNKVNEARRQFTQIHDREPTIEELAELLGVKTAEILGMIKENSHHVSVDAPITNDENVIPMIDLMSLGAEDSPDLKLMEESVKKEVKEGLEVLSPREVEIIEAYYGLNGMRAHSYDEIAKMFNLSKERVRQIQDRAIRRMRKSFSRNSMLTIFR